VADFSLARSHTRAYISILVSAVGMIIFGLPFPPSLAPAIAPIASGLAGIGLSCFNTIWFTLLQEKVPDEKLGRVFSLDTSGSFAMIPMADPLAASLPTILGLLWFVC
jgi:MFS family permease